MKQFSSFNLHLYTEIVFGKETEAQTGELVKKHGGTKVLMVYGGGSIKKSGLYERVEQSLTEAGIPFVELAGVNPNPRRSLVDKGIALAREQGIDFILPVGGGSTLDTAKAISFALCFKVIGGTCIPTKPTRKPVSPSAASIPSARRAAKHPRLRSSWTILTQGSSTVAAGRWHVPYSPS